jgi:hypothetical protein
VDSWTTAVTKDDEYDNVSCMTAWIEVLKAMVDGPHPPVQGVIARSGQVESGIYSYSGDIAPVYIAGVDDLQVWRDGAKVRVETMAGDPVVISNGEAVWRFSHREQYPVRGEAREMAFMGPGKELLITRPAKDWVGDRWTTPTGPVKDVDYLGRPCWSVELAPPRGKEPFARQLIVDQRTGAVVQQRVDAAGTAVSFIEFTAGIPIDPAMFIWSGETSVPDVYRRTDFKSVQTPSLGMRTDEQQQWFRDHVTDKQLSVPVTLDLHVLKLRSHHDDGSFDATIGDWPLGRLARRPRSTEEWNLEWDIPVGHAWTTEGFDWAVGLTLGVMDVDALAVLRGLLHPHESVLGAPPIVRSGNQGRRR